MNSARRAEVTITILSNIETVHVHMWLAGHMHGSDDIVIMIAMPQY
jgi:hypothetical protein